MRIALRNKSEIKNKISSEFVCVLLQSLRIFTNEYKSYEDKPPTTPIKVGDTEYQSIHVSSSKDNSVFVFIILGITYDVYRLAYYGVLNN